MTANALVQARVDKAIKLESAKTLATIGPTVSDAVRMPLNRIAQNKALPFAPLVPNAKTIAAMKEARRGKGSRFQSVDTLLADLNAKN